MGTKNKSRLINLLVKRPRMVINYRICSITRTITYKLHIYVNSKIKDPSHLMGLAAKASTEVSVIYQGPIMETKTS